jgi:3-oxoacyl-[acyl-carrier-protein] synthase II
MTAAHISLIHGAKGPNSTITTACAAGTQAVGEAFRLIGRGDCDLALAGGSDSRLDPLLLLAYCALGALSPANRPPEQVSRPFDGQRDGFVLGEGAGAVVVEEYEHAKARGAKIYAEVIGYGMSGDAYHITAPAENGDGAYRCMRAALKRAEIDVSDIDYVNAHGTSTPMGDEIELGAVERLFGNASGKLAMSSTKSATGHLLGAAGAIEAIFSALAIRDNIAPPTLNLDNPSVETAIDLVPHTAKKREINTVLSNSFGFGGTNASLILRRVA